MKEGLSRDGAAKAGSLGARRAVDPLKHVARHTASPGTIRYLTAAMAFNLGRIMRLLVGAGKPRHLAVLAERLCLTYFVMTSRREIRRRPFQLLRTITDTQLATKLRAA